MIIVKYLIYKITNNVNGRYYIGRHTTRDIHDNYMGSGKAIRNAIKKYGKEYFTKEIIAEANSAEDLWELERQIVNESVVKDPLSYNMTYGGKSYLDGLKKYDPIKFLHHQSEAGKIGGVAVRKNKTPTQIKEWHILGGKSNAKKQKILGTHPFYTGEAAKAGGKAVKGMLELWNPCSTAYNKNQKEYNKGDSVKANPESEKYKTLRLQGWRTIDEHRARLGNKL